MLHLPIVGTGISCGATFVTVAVDEGTATLSNLTFVGANEITATVSIGADTPTEKACVSVLVGNDGPIQPAATTHAQSSCVPQGDYSAVKTVQIYRTVIQAQNANPTGTIFTTGGQQ
ncbi:MAG: hypothetical protein WBG54_05820 [Acidobacteriaceae bacterium]